MAKPVTKDLRPAARIFAEYLRKSCRGRDNAQPKWRVLPVLQSVGLQITPRDYDELAMIALELGYDVGTWRKGAFWMVDETDFLTAEANLLTRFGPMREHHQLYAARRLERFSTFPLLEASRVEVETALTAENAENAKKN